MRAKKPTLKSRCEDLEKELSDLKLLLKIFAYAEYLKYYNEMIEPGDWKRLLKANQLDTKKPNKRKSK